MPEKSDKAPVIPSPWRKARDHVKPPTNEPVSMECFTVSHPPRVKKMPLRTSSVSGPEFKGSTSSIQARRKISFTEHVPARHPSNAVALDILADSLYKSQSVTLGNHADTPIDNVRQVMESSQPNPAPLYCELLYMGADTVDSEDNPVVQWAELSRWIKYEQKVEGDGTRFSKPHITLLNVQALIQLKNCLRRGVVVLDSNAESFVEVVDEVILNCIHGGFLNPDQENLVKDALFASKLHLVQGKMRKTNDITTDEAFAASRKPGATSPTTESLSSSSQEDVDPKYNEIDERLLHKLDKNTQAAVIFVANIEALTNSLTAFIRLKEPKLFYPEIPDYPLPVKFVFVALNPRDNYQDETVGIGRTMGALFADEVFKKVAFFSSEPGTIGDAIEEFLTQIVAIPPGKCSTKTRWEPHEDNEVEARKMGMLYADYDDPFDDENCEETDDLPNLAPARIIRTGRLFGGLIEDVKRKAPYYGSEFTDFFTGRISQSLAVAIFLFFANITSIITFGGVMEKALHHQMAAIENIVCGGLCGVIFAMFSGQPLNILSATGPTLIFEKILFDFCTDKQWEFLPFRFWVGLWTAFYLLVLVATDASALVGLITRFTEEAFATLVSIVFIIQAFQKLYEIGYEAPITIHPEEVLHSSCQCVLEIADGNTTILRNLSVGVTRCHELGGTPEGLQCFFKPDVYMFSVVLTFGTFSIAYALNSFRVSRFFTSKIRHSVSDFGVLIAIVSMTILTHLIGLEVPSLKVPSSLRPTLDRSWLVDIMNIESIEVIGIAALPALFYTILIVMDQQITAVIINRKDNQLRKGYGYHLDLFVILALVIICSSLGLPFYVAATVLSVMHVDSLKIQSECAAPGEKPKFLGVKEQRLTAVLAHLVIFGSVFVTSLIKLVPLPVLTGIFLYMGVISLLGQQFVQRCMLLFMPIKHQPDYTWLRTVRMNRVHLFTFFQILSILALFAVKYAKGISMVFPLMLVVMVIVRMYVLEKLFTKSELLALDDEVPSFRDVMTAPKRHNKFVISKNDEEMQQLKGKQNGSSYTK